MPPLVETFLTALKVIFCGRRKNSWKYLKDLELERRQLLKRLERFNALTVKLFFVDARDSRPGDILRADRGGCKRHGPC